MLWLVFGLTLYINRRLWSDVDDNSDDETVNGEDKKRNYGKGTKTEFDMLSTMLINSYGGMMSQVRKSYI